MKCIVQNLPIKDRNLMAYSKAHLIDVVNLLLNKGAGWDNAEKYDDGKYQDE